MFQGKKISVKRPRLTFDMFVKSIAILSYASSGPVEVKWDRTYKLPKIVECFLERASQECPDGWEILPWTLNRAVSVFHLGEYMWSFTYEALELDIVKALDDNQRFMLMVEKYGEDGRHQGNDPQTPGQAG
jgi:hypothetical protein